MTGPVHDAPAPVDGASSVTICASRCLCMLGMHRSGTSALARVINLLGIDLGSQLVPAGVDNPKGFWEHKDIVQVHERLFEALDTWYDDTLILPPRWTEFESVDVCREGIKRIVRDDLAPRGFWGFKDPRTCRLLPLWQELFVELRVSPSYVLMLRNPWEIAYSLAVRNGFAVNKSLLLTLLHLLEAEHHTRGGVRAVVTYDELMQDWRATTARLGAALGLDVQTPSEASAVEIDSFIDPRLRHHSIAGSREKARPATLPGDARLVKWVTEVYDLLAAGASSTARVDGKLFDEARLDAIHDELLASIDEFDHWRGELSLGRRIRELEFFVGDLNQSKTWLEAENQRLRAELEAGDTVGPGTNGSAHADVPARSAPDRLKEQIGRLVTWNKELASARDQASEKITALRGQLEEQERVNARLIAGKWSTTRTRRGRPVSVGPTPAVVNTLVPEPTRVVVEPLMASVDTSTLVHARRGPLDVRGWCVHPRTRIRFLRAGFGRTIVDCTYGLERLDVAAHLPAVAHARDSGFEAVFPYEPDKGEVRLDAVLEDGQVMSFVSTHVIELPHIGLVRLTRSVAYEWKEAIDRKSVTAATWLRAKARRVRNGVEFLRFLMRLAKARLARTGGLPGARETVRLMRIALHDFLVARQTKAALPVVQNADLPLPRAYTISKSVDPYEAWQRLNTWTPDSKLALQRRLTAARDTGLSLPRISVVMPVYNPPVKFLNLAIQSVVSQVYADWEFCIADDQSTDPEVFPLLEHWAANEPRIKLVRRETNGNISRATNSAADLATSEFLFFLDHDDELTPDSLAETALYLAHNPDADFVYSDDDKIDIHGNRFAPQFKPDFSPELLLSYMYLGHIGVVRASIYRELGGLRVGFEGSQDYDFALRATEKARKVGHIPLVLYHWRAVPGSTALSGGAKPKAFEAGRKSVQEALDRRGQSTRVFQPKWATMAGAGIYAHSFPDDGPTVAILIPTKNNTRTLRTCVESLAVTAYRNFRVVVLDNESDKPEAVQELRDLEATGVTVLRIGNPPARNGRWSFSYLNNEAVRRVEAEFVVFMNDDIEVRDGQWLSQMVGYGKFDGVGAVGARLLYPDNRIQHAGVLHGLHHGLAGHAFKLVHANDNGYQAYAKVTRNYSAVTAACMLTRREVFLKLGGFDETEFAVAYNDVDYCYRLVDAGLRCVYAPGAELTHHEGFSRGFKDNPAEAATFRRKYNDRVDPFYSPYLSLETEQFRIQPRHLSRDDLYGQATGPAGVPRIMMFSNALNLTGGPLHQYEIAVHLKRTGQAEPILWCNTTGPLQKMYADAGIEVMIEEHPLTHAVGSESVYDRAARELGEWMQWRGIDLVYANTLESFLAVEAAYQAGIPSVWNVHESEPWQTYFIRFGDPIAARALRCFEYPYRVVFVSDATRDAYLPLNSQWNFTVVHNGLDTRRLDTLVAGRTKDAARNILGVADGDLVLLLLGTVCDRKGQIDLPAALSHLPVDLHDRLRVFIVGDRAGPYSERVHAAASALPEDLRKRVAFVEETHDTPLYYLTADLFICTSRVESFPRVIAEAMYFGLPVVTTPVFGIREQITPGVNGLYYDPDRPTQLADAILQLLKDPDLRTTFGENTKHVLRKLNSFEDMNRAYATTFREAIGSGVHAPKAGASKHG